MTFFEQLWSNKVLMAALAGWLFAQLVKMVLYGIMNREFRLERLIGSGGMPSSHAAMVCALTVAVLKQHGIGSFEFAIAFILAVVVLHDARGVRLETGKQAMTITAIVQHLLKEGEEIDLPELELKELIGHTAIQVLVGSLMGIAIGILL